MDNDVGVLELLDLEAEAGEEETVAGRQRRGEPFLHRSQLAAVLETDGYQRLLDDHAGVEAMLLRDARLGDPPHSARFGHKPPELVIGFQRVTAGRDEVQDLLER